MSSRRVTRAQLEAKKYIEQHNLERLFGQLLNNVVQRRSPNPKVFILQYLSERCTPSELKAAGLSVLSAKDRQRRDDERDEEKEGASAPQMEDMPLPDESKAAIKGTLTRDLYNTTVQQTPGGTTLRDCLRLGIEHPESLIGLIAWDTECYDVFSDIFSELMASQHVHRSLQLHTDLAAHSIARSESFERLPLATLDSKRFVFARMRASRNVKGYPFTPKITAAQRAKLSETIEEAFQKMPSTLGVQGDYVPVRALEERQPHLKHRLSRLGLFPHKVEMLDCIDLNREWPTGRLMWLGDDMETAIWVNTTDHVKVVKRVTSPTSSAFQKGLLKVAEILELIARTLGSEVASQAYSYHSTFGFLSYDPGNAGHSLRCSVGLRLPGLCLAGHQRLREEADGRGLKIGKYTRLEEGVVELVWRSRFGADEVETLTKLLEAAQGVVRVDQILMDELLSPFAATWRADLSPLLQMALDHEEERGGGETAAIETFRHQRRETDISLPSRDGLFDVDAAMAAGLQLSHITQQNSTLLTPSQLETFRMLQHKMITEDDQQGEEGAPRLEFKWPILDALLTCCLCPSGDTSWDGVTSCGVSVGEAAAYDVYQELFDPLIAAYHKVEPQELQHDDLVLASPTCPSDAPTAPLKDRFIQTLSQTYVPLIVAKVQRNVANEPFVPGALPQQLTHIETKLRATFHAVESSAELSTAIEPDAQYVGPPAVFGFSDSPQDKLGRDLMFPLGFYPNLTEFHSCAGFKQKWPIGRSAFLSGSCLWGGVMNARNHLDIASCDAEGNALRCVERLFHVLRAFQSSDTDMAFAYSNRLGYLTALPEGLGTALELSARLVIPKLMEDHLRPAMMDNTQAQHPQQQESGGEVRSQRSRRSMVGRDTSELAKMCAEHRLAFRFVESKKPLKQLGNSGLVWVRTVSSLGMSEAQVVEQFNRGVSELIEREEELATEDTHIPGADADAMLPVPSFDFTIKGGDINEITAQLRGKQTDSGFTLNEIALAGEIFQLPGGASAGDEESFTLFKPLTHAILTFLHPPWAQAATFPPLSVFTPIESGSKALVDASVSHQMDSPIVCPPGLGKSEWQLAVRRNLQGTPFLTSTCTTSSFSGTTNRGVLSLREVEKALVPAMKKCAAFKDARHLLVESLSAEDQSLLTGQFGINLFENQRQESLPRWWPRHRSVLVSAGDTPTAAALINFSDHLVIKVIGAGRPVRAVFAELAAILADVQTQMGECLSPESLVWTKDTTEKGSAPNTSPRREEGDGNGGTNGQWTSKVFAHGPSVGFMGPNLLESVGTAFTPHIRVRLSRLFLKTNEWERFRSLPTVRCTEIPLANGGLPRPPQQHKEEERRRESSSSHTPTEDRQHETLTEGEGGEGDRKESFSSSAAGGGEGDYVGYEISTTVQMSMNEAEATRHFTDTITSFLKQCAHYHVADAQEL